jgi:hypothetical protein
MRALFIVDGISLCNSMDVAAAAAASSVIVVEVIFIVYASNTFDFAVAIFLCCMLILVIFCTGSCG